MGQEEYKKPKIYFKENKEEPNNKINSNDTHQIEKIKLFFTLQECIPNTNYQIKISSINDNNNNHKFIFETEILKPDEDNLIVYETTYLLTYFFEKEQKLIYKIIINNEEINYETTLGCIVGTRNSTLIQNISNERTEKIKIQAYKVDVSNKNKLKLHFIVKKGKERRENMKKTFEHKFLFKIISQQDLYRSEIVSDDGFLKPVIIPIYLLVPSFSIIFYNLKQEVLTSFSNLTYEKLLIMNGSEYPIYYNLKNQKKYNLLINTEIIGTTNTLLDYIKHGMQINMAIAIDFSKASEKLHEFENDKMNRYEEAIKYCGDIVSYYNNDQLFPVWGFGADNVPDNFNRMCFPINFKEDPKIATINGVMKEYRNCLKKITFSESAEFSPVIQNFTKMIEDDKEHMNEYYYILLLLTDGKYDDREKTIDAIVKASKLPMSIILVGLRDLNEQSKGQFDIVYMIDATGSMGNYLKAAKDQCINISNELQKKFIDYKIQFGGVFYRDPIDCPKEKNEMIDLSDDVFSLRFFISCLKAVGGGDEAEDWAGGYDLAINKINWRNGIKLIIHICDADGHGKEFTNKEDNHPDDGIKYPPLLQKCVEKQIKVIGFNINKGANTSFSEFKKIYDKIDKNRRGLYKFQDFKESENLAETFKESVVEAATFAAMMELNADSQPLVSSNGEKWERHIVQFVPYDKYKNNPKILSEKVLEEIPIQIVQYYNNKHLKDAKKDGFDVIDDFELINF